MYLIWVLIFLNLFTADGSGIAASQCFLVLQDRKNDKVQINKEDIIQKSCMNNFFYTIKNVLVTGCELCTCRYLQLKTLIFFWQYELPYFVPP